MSFSYTTHFFNRPTSLWSISTSPLPSTLKSLSSPSPLVVALSAGARIRLSLFSPSLLREAVSLSKKSGAAFCAPAGSEAPTNVRLARPLTSRHTNWQCKLPLDKKREAWCSWHTGGNIQYDSARSHRAFDRRGDIKAHWWNIILHTVQWCSSVCWMKDQMTHFTCQLFPLCLWLKCYCLNTLWSLSNCISGGHLYYFLSACVIFLSPLVILERGKGRKWEK